MKISCQTCQAKYTIADEKVAGKVVKIKCKKCGSTIVVNGNDPTALPDAHDHAPMGGGDDDDGATKIFMEAPAGAGGAAGPDDWTVNVTDEDQRTMTSAAIAIEIAKGVVTRDTYVWKDGMSDWLPVVEVPDLAAFLAVAPAAAAAPAAAPAPAAPLGGLGGTMMMEQPSPVAAARPVAAAASPAGAARRAGARPGNVDLFGGSSEPAAVAPPAASGDKAVGERNENSVLFSLSALTATENAAKASKKDDAVLDLSPSKPRKNGGRAGFDDIMNLGGGGIGGGMGQSPALAPPPLLAPVVEAPPPQAAPAMQMAPGLSGGTPYSSPTPAKKSPVGIIIGAVIALAIIGGVAVFALKGGGPPPVASATPDATVAPTQAAAVPSAVPSATTTAVAAADTTAPTAAPADTSGAASGKTPAVGGPMPGAPASKATSAPAPDAKTAVAAAAAAAPPPAADPATPAPPPAAAGGGNGEFNRGAASAALGAAAGGAKGCKKPDGPTGQGRVKVTFAPSGNVTTAQVDGPPFAGSSVGGCIAGAFRGAHVPPFDGSPVTVSKSFTIN